MNRQLMTIGEAATYLGISVSHLYKMCSIRSIDYKLLHARCQSYSYWTTLSLSFRRISIVNEHNTNSPGSPGNVNLSLTGSFFK